ncbi:Tethering factor for nuclear proteasome sts1 [Physocladia obscura]|uniref:Tethering factor for nuclear proteasome STS1 n=1 Tax=Physocladia obscura TaxID=109957 RepID=A0AAD5SZX9_9FUNG|nr:Tethering factor for nuclear proteasome sts1 [Physocladia obscura]
MAHLRVSWGSVAPNVNAAQASFGAVTDSQRLPLVSNSVTTGVSTRGNASTSAQANVNINAGTNLLVPVPSVTNNNSSNTFENNGSGGSANGNTNNRKRKASADYDDAMMDADSPPASSLSPFSSPRQAQHQQQQQQQQALAVRRRARVIEGRGGIAPAKRLRLVWAEDEGGDSGTGVEGGLAGPEGGAAEPESGAEADREKGERTLPLGRILETLSKPALLLLLKDLIKHDPTALLAQRTAALLPRPSRVSAAAHLKSALDALDAAFPYTSTGLDKASDYAWGRVKSALADLIDILSLYLTHFTEPCSYPLHLTHEYPFESFAFLETASHSVLSRLPRFSNETRNEDGINKAYRLVARAYRVAIAECCRRIRVDGRMFPVQVVGGWFRDLCVLRDVVAGKFGFSEAADEFMRGEIGNVLMETMSSTSVPSVSASSTSSTSVEINHFVGARGIPLFG